MSTTLSVAEMAAHFAEYLNRVANGGESFVLVQDDNPIAELRPLSRGKYLGDLPALLAELPRLSASEAEAFGADIEAAREELSRLESRDPWAS